MPLEIKQTYDTLFSAVDENKAAAIWRYAVSIATETYGVQSTSESESAKLFATFIWEMAMFKVLNLH